MYSVKILLNICIAVLMFVLGPAHANLIRNASFENVPSTQMSQGILPSDWLQLAPSPGADTYSNDGSYGLAPSGFGNFTGVTAFDGNRWIAGWSLVPETFGQILTTPLTPGNEYTLSAFLHQAVRGDLANTGSYEIGLASNASLSNLSVVGQFGLTSGPNVWESRSLTFIAPSAAPNLPFLAFKPIGSPQGNAYPGLDLVSLTTSVTNPVPVPEPSSFLLIAIGLLGSIVFPRTRSHQGMK